MKLSKQQQRQRRKLRIRKKINGTADRPRLVVYRSSKHIYAQVVDDVNGHTLAASSSLGLWGKDETNKLNTESATKVGKDLADKAKAAKIESVVFDRNGYPYHGRIKALADGAREGGLKF
jgi:large subunit ribosomal protein L18